MKKAWIGFSLMALALAGSALWMSQGCVGKIPTFATVVATSTAVLPGDYVANFENGNVEMNPYLTNSSNGFFADLAFPSYNKINTSFIAQNPGDGSQFAIHVFGTLTDKGDATYPDFDVKGYFNLDCATCPYNATPFTGIQFDYYWPNVTDGQGHHPPSTFWFDLATQRTSPQSQGGLCDSQSAPSGVPCYDHFAISLPHNVAWGTVSRNFTALTSEYSGYGWQAADAQKFLYLEYRATANNAAGVYNVDYWVDNIKFLP